MLTQSSSVSVNQVEMTCDSLLLTVTHLELPEMKAVVVLIELLTFPSNDLTMSLLNV